MLKFTAKLQRTQKHIPTRNKRLHGKNQADHSVNLTGQYMKLKKQIPDR